MLLVFFVGSTQEQGPGPSSMQDAHCVVRARVLRKSGSGALQATPAKRGRGRLSTSRRTGETKKWCSVIEQLSVQVCKWLFIGIVYCNLPLNYPRSNNTFIMLKVQDRHHDEWRRQDTSGRERQKPENQLNQQQNYLLWLKLHWMQPLHRVVWQPHRLYNKQQKSTQLHRLLICLSCLTALIQKTVTGFTARYN